VRLMHLERVRWCESSARKHACHVGVAYCICVGVHVNTPEPGLVLVVCCVS